VSAPRIPHFIDGTFVEPASGEFLPVFEPATGAVFAEVADGDARDIERAVEAASRAFPGWSHTPAAERARLLSAVADRIEARLDDLARDESADTGKPISLARAVDIPRAVANLRFFAGAILHTSDEAHVTDHAALNVTLRRPRGVAACISPWNLPLYLFTWKIAPALATGNTVVGKPSEITPLTAFRLAEICREAGLPRGVLNVVHGVGAKVGPALTTHPEVRAVSFTGGTATGAAIAKEAAPRFKKLSLELGGKNPNVIFADADLDAAVSTSLRAAFSNQGQICLCGSRILVEREAHDAFLERFAAAASSLRIGDPLDPATEQGAVVSKTHFEKILSYIDLAREEGGTIVAGGGPAEPAAARCKGGWFVRPTVITGLPVTCRTNQEEIFGPVVTVQPFEDEAEAVALANATPYGLAATLWTRDLDRAHRVAEAIEAGIVWVNCWMVRDLRTPFGGMKASGVGREGGEEALRFFTEPKNVCFAIGCARR
jgi:aminomuconate-semialdehyde/2-hydroxymuconate-6-semialdehyde dehydrogenase